MSSATMQAIRVHQYGSPQELRLETIPRPEPQAGELLVRVHAAGVLPMETAVRQGEFAGVMPKSFPYTPGTAFSGVVEALGEGVDKNITEYAVGQAICGRAPNGTYAEYVTVSVMPPPPTKDNEGFKFTQSIVPLAPKPVTLSFDEAATLSGGATTAWTSVIEDGGIQPGQTVLIQGAAGGVGLFAVQFARWRGATVIATTSTGNVDFVRSLGAETVIDYTNTRFDDVMKDVDFVLDTVGGDTMLRSMQIVRRGGTLISVYDTPPAELAESLGIRASMNQTFPASAHLRKIVQLIEDGHVKPAIRQIFPLGEAPAAHALSETGHGRGRIVLHIAD